MDGFRPVGSGVPTNPVFLAPGALDRLRAMWAAGDSTATIGRAFGVSKNIIVGKVHRLDLPSRPNPSVFGRPPAAPLAPRPPRAPAQPTAESASAVERLRAAWAVGQLRAPMPPRTLPPLPVITAPAPIAAPAPTFAAPASVAARPAFARTWECCWPIGTPKTPTFRFCCANAAPGRPYCTIHCAKAYVQVRYRREDAGQHAMGGD